MKTYINRDHIISIKVFPEILEHNIKYYPPKKHWWGYVKRILDISLLFRAPKDI